MPVPAFPRRPKAVVFDLDGTVIDSENLVLEAYTAATARFGVPFSHAQFLTLVGQHREATEARLRGYFGDALSLPDFFAAVSEHIGERAAPLKPGAIELLDFIGEVGAPIALATSSGRPWVDRHFAAHGLTPHFRAIVTRQDVTNGKPHPEPYLKAAALLGFDPADVLALEDSPTGVASAHAAGMMTVMTPDLIQPDDETRSRVLHVAASLHDVRAMLAALDAS